MSILDLSANKKKQAPNPEYYRRRRQQLEKRRGGGGGGGGLRPQSRKRIGKKAEMTETQGKAGG
jgi:hypothetical protein